MSVLINTVSEVTIGIMETKDDDTEVYVPLILWNLVILSYLSDPDLSYRAYGCMVKIQSRAQAKIKSFLVYIKESEMYKFDRVRAEIVAQTHGELVMHNRFDLSLWSDLVPKLIFDSSMTIMHQRPARNIGLAWNYLKKMSFEFGGVPQLEHVEIVYKDVVYNGLGEVLTNPVHALVPDAFPNKIFRVSRFLPSGLRGYLQHCLPPYTSSSKFRRDQQVLVLIGATGMISFMFTTTISFYAQVNISIA